MNELVPARLKQLMNLREEVETLTVGQRWQPAIDWIDEGTHLILVVDVPGVNANSLELQESGDTVTIAGHRVLNEKVVYSERLGGLFSRTLTFPEEIVPQSGQANINAGVLTIKFEKRHPTIDVNNI